MLTTSEKVISMEKKKMYQQLREKMFWYQAPTQTSCGAKTRNTTMSKKPQEGAIRPQTFANLKLCKHLTKRITRVIFIRELKLKMLAAKMAPLPRNVNENHELRTTTNLLDLHG
mmetsp:Transcript_33779/g.80172  ORF Transcript_33779/g.80172 Transcript_33779/m.80172 type:complete len:114 (+) Transcript_33779:617-958(+)